MALNIANGKVEEKAIKS